MSIDSLVHFEAVRAWARDLPAADATHQPELAAQVQACIDAKTKPLGALGRLEALAHQLALIQGNVQPVLREPHVLVFAADHGIARQGVSAYPVEVTPQMVRNFLNEGAAVSIFARAHGVRQCVIDCGVQADFEPHPDLLMAKVQGVEHGTADSSVGPAMTSAQAVQAIAQGRALLQQVPGNAVLLGEMGIGNTSSAALLMHALTGLQLADCVGRGTGLDDAGVTRKRAILARALEANAGALASGDPLVQLAALGGLEIATMVGSVLQAAHERRVVVVDGFITTSAVAVAAALAPQVLDYCVFAHQSAETGHRRWLDLLLGASHNRALLSLDLRLGEGSGAVLAWPLLRAAVVMLNEMASFASAGVSGRAA